MKLDAETILKEGKHLIEKQSELSDQDFRNYIKKEYNRLKRLRIRTKGWMRAFERFENRLDLIKNLPETMIIILADRSLTMEEVEQLIANRRDGKIDPDVRSMERAISKIKNSKKLGKREHEEERTTLSFSPELPRIKELWRDPRLIQLGLIQMMQQDAMIYNGVTEEQLRRNTRLAISGARRRQLQKSPL